MLYIHWNPSPDFITFGTFAIKWYGVLWGLALLSCFLIGQYVFKVLRRDDAELTIVIQYGFVGGLIGARLAHVVFYALDYYLANPLKIIAVWEGGLASHGGLVGGLLGVYIFSLRHKQFSFMWLLDFTFVCTVLLASLIRLGNLMNSELYGVVTNVTWAFVFEQVDELPRHPVVLYESIAYFLIQMVMILLFHRYKESKPGLYVGVFLALLFSVRLLLEFFKVPDGEVIAGVISKTQLLNVPFIIAGVVLLYLVSKNKLKYPVAVNGQI